MSAALEPKERPAASDPHRFSEVLHARLGRDGLYFHATRHATRRFGQGQQAPDTVWAAALGTVPPVGTMYVCLAVRVCFPPASVPKLYVGVVPSGAGLAALAAGSLDISPGIISAYGVGRGAAHAHDRAPAKRSVESVGEHWHAWRCLIGVRFDTAAREATIVDHCDASRGVIRVSIPPGGAKLVIAGTQGRSGYAAVEVKGYKEVPFGMPAPGVVKVVKP